MAKVKVTYRFEGDFETEIEIVDAHITEVLEEWQLDHIDGWEPNEDDVKAAINELLDNDYSGTLDYTADWECGWADYTDIEVEEVLEPYVLNAPAPEIDGQLALDETALDA